MSQIFSENMFAPEAGIAIRVAPGDRLRGTELEGGQMVDMALSNRPYFPGRLMIVKMLRDDG